MCPELIYLPILNLFPGGFATFSHTSLAILTFMATPHGQVLVQRTDQALVSLDRASCTSTAG